MKQIPLEMEALNQCLKCSLCVAYCPVSRVNPEFPGPKQLGVDLLRWGQVNLEQLKLEVEACSNCKTCETVCPSGVRIATLNQRVKSEYKTRRRVRELLFSNPDLLGRLAQISPRVTNRALALSPIQALLERVLGISVSSMPPYSLSSLNRQKKLQAKPNGASNAVLYFPGCFAQYNKPEIGMSLIKILQKLNYEVILPSVTCCGQPAISNGNLKRTRALAKQNYELLKGIHKKGMPILFSCPSCLLTFKEEYQNILEHEGERYSELTPYMMEAMCFIQVHEVELKHLVSLSEVALHSLGYHEPCHLRALGQGTPSLFLLNRLWEQAMIPLEAGCCGLAGSYGFKSEKGWITREIGRNLQEALRNQKLQAIVTECGMCSVQIQQLSPLRVYHPLELLECRISD